MEAKYLCPSCRNCINVGDDLVFIGKTKTGLKGIIFLHSHIGNYRVRFSSDFSIIQGNTVTFSCPICHHSLSYHKQKNKAQFVRVKPNKEEESLVFSEIYGEKCKYEVIRDQLK